MPRAAGSNRQLPQVKNAERLDSLKGWPVSIAYFEPGSGKQDALPVYELSFLMFENGVSRKLYIDYGEFALQGELTEITFHPPSQVRRRCTESSDYPASPTPGFVARAARLSSAGCMGFSHSHAAPRTPLASPQRGGMTVICARSAKTCGAIRPGSTA